MQSELEIVTEQMSDIVARSHLRATQTQILFLTVGAADRRSDFTNLIITLMSEERKRKRESNEKKKRGKRCHNMGMSSATPSSSDEGISPFVVRPASRGVLSEEDNDGTERQEEQDQAYNQAHEAVREALRASLEAFMANTEDNTPTFMAHVDLEDNGDDSDEEVLSDWACLACTYVNSSGRECAMCGTRRGMQPNIS